MGRGSGREEREACAYGRDDSVLPPSLSLLRDDHIIMFISRYNYLKISGLDSRKDRSYFLSP